MITLKNNARIDENGEVLEANMIEWAILLLTTTSLADIKKAHANVTINPKLHLIQVKCIFYQKYLV